MLTETQKTRLAEVLYPRALAETVLPDTDQRRAIAASDYFQFLTLGGTRDEEAVMKIAQGLRADADAAQGN